MILDSNSRSVIGHVSLRPEEVGAHHYGNVACCHLCHLVVLRKLVQESQQIPRDRQRGIMCEQCMSSRMSCMKGLTDFRVALCAGGSRDKRSFIFCSVVLVSANLQRYTYIQEKDSKFSRFFSGLTGRRT